MANLVSHLQSAAGSHPDETAIWFDGTAITYEQLWGQTGRFAAALAERGFEPGDRLAIYLPNLPQYVIAFHGALRAGCVVVPMNPQYKHTEIGHLLADSGAKGVVAFGKLLPYVSAVQDDTAVEHVVSVGEGSDEVGDEGGNAVPFEEFLSADALDVVARDDDDVAVQPYTSGTTGQPKGVQLTHHNLGWNALAAADLLPEGIGPGDKQLGVLPLFHIYGMTVVMNATLFNGGAYYPLPSWDARQAIGLVEDQRLTLMHGVPAMYNDVINQPDAESFDLSSLRMGGVGGAGIPVEVLRRFEELYDVKIYEGYGLTETSPVTHFNSPAHGRRVGSIGKPLPGVDSMVVDGDFEPVERVEEGPVDEEAVDLDEITGEIVVSGPNVMKSYYGLDDANEAVFTAGDGRSGSKATGTSEEQSSSGKRWFHTGDVGYWDEDDYFYVVDRKKHVIVSGGYNVYPRELEELLFEHEAVADVAIVGIPDERRGEIPKAFVVPVPDADVSEEEIRQYCLDNLAAYKHPREVAFVEELPRTTTGKVQKFDLRESETDDGSS